MYNEALVNALNADKQRAYDELERIRRQREILAQRVQESGAAGDGSSGRPARRHHRSAAFGRVATR
ncbi:hypothetical protein ACO2Q7_05330 [Rathayibacter sp. KR2-224]|uniref:hypothetical protein n=1 Tax=Rathayibacter sp. KR2-224 TaxID=3400913 RepID=UPI003C0CAE05